MKIKYKKEIDTLRAEVQQLEEKNRKLESEQDSYNLQEQGSKEKTKELQQFLEAIGQLGYAEFHLQFISVVTKFAQ
jgi:predicted RNase H-like nuclease (RuvC/YqgF family)